ncbi:MAG: lactate utilization protein [Bacteroidota bacterium]
MGVSSSKEAILKKIREALSESTPFPFPLSEGSNSLYIPQQKELEVQFAEEFNKLQGRFSFCLNSEELCLQLIALFAEKNWTKIFCNESALKHAMSYGRFENLYSTSLVDCDASITSCEVLVARTGSVVLSAASESGRTVSVYAPVHICIAYSRQLVYDIKDALQQIKEKYQQNMPSLISFATGPSRTADIEKTLVTGVHGPKEVYVFLVDET